MRTFEHPNYKGKHHCPICKKQDDKPIVLLGIPGTEEDGIIEAQQYHVDCVKFLVKEWEAMQ